MYRDLILKIISELDREKIPYMIIGGQAILLHGEPRMTQDIDITLGIDIDDYKKIESVITKLKLEPLVGNIQGFLEKTRTLPVRDSNTGVRIDIIFSFIGYERQAIERGKKFRYKNQSINYASKEDMIIMKIIAGRSRDLDDAAGIMLKNKNLDEKYIRKWLNEFSGLLERDFIAIYEKLRADSIF